MPGFDGTGPRGQGPFTGGGRGFCVGYPVGNKKAALGRGGFGRGRRSGRRGYGYWAAQDSTVNTAKSETEMLNEQARFLQEELKVIQQRIKTLESASISESND